MNGRMNIAWVTADSFIDVDLPILGSLKQSSKVSINWFVVLRKKRIVSFREDELYKEFSNSKVLVYITKLEHRFISFYTFLILFKLCISLKRTNPDLVYVNAELEPYFTILLTLFFGRSKVIYSLHDVEMHSGSNKFVVLWSKIKSRLIKNIHVFSESQEQLFNSIYHNHKKTIFRIRLFLKSFGLPKNIMKDVNHNKIYFLFFGTIRSNKGLDILINAVNQIPAKFDGKYIIRIYGKCDNWSLYENLIKDHSRFELAISPVKNQDIPNLFCSSDYLILPYRDVTQSGPLMLAFNYRIPVIASKLPGFNEYIESGINGVLFESESPDSLAKSLIKCLLYNSSTYSSLLVNLDKYVQTEFKIDKISEQYIEMFESIK